ncbi:MAG: hypothetical protein V1806_07460 [Pseudomonadota bacterium]
MSKFLPRKGPTDYALFVAGKPVGVVEAKKVGTTLSGVADQAAIFGEVSRSRKLLACKVAGVN